MKMTEYQRKLVETHLYIVDRIIRKKIVLSKQPLMSYEDLYQIGCEALCRAALKYEPARGSFEPFGARYVYNAMIDHCRVQNCVARHTAELQLGDNGEPIAFRDLGDDPDHDGIVAGKKLNEVLMEAEKRHAGITQRGIEAIQLKSLGYSSREIAEKNGTTVNNVNAWISRARRKLREDPAIAEQFI